MKTILATAVVATTMLAGTAVAAPVIESSTPLFKDIPITESVEVCRDVVVKEEKPGVSIEGLIIGGLIGNAVDDQNGAAAGALIGGLAAGSTTETRVETQCQTETRITGYTKELVGYNVVINVDGKKYYFTLTP